MKINKQYSTFFWVLVIIGVYIFLSLPKRMANDYNANKSFGGGGEAVRGKDKEKEEKPTPEQLEKARNGLAYTA